MFRLRLGHRAERPRRLELPASSTSFRPLVPSTVRVPAGTGAARGAHQRLRQRAATSPTRTSRAASTLEVTGLDATHADEPPGEGHAVAEPARRRDRRRDLRPVRRSSRWCSRPRRRSSSRRGRPSSAAPTSASCAGSRGATASTATSSPSRSPGIDLGFFRPRRAAGAPQAVLNVDMGSETNVAGFSVRYDMTQPDRRPSPPASTRDQGAAAGARARRRCSRRWARADAAARAAAAGRRGPADTGRDADGRAPGGGAGDRRPLEPGGRRARATRRARTSASCGRAGSSPSAAPGRLYNGSVLRHPRPPHDRRPDGYEQRFEARAQRGRPMTGAELYVEVCMNEHGRPRSGPRSTRSSGRPTASTASTAASSPTTWTRSSSGRLQAMRARGARRESRPAGRCRARRTPAPASGFYAIPPIGAGVWIEFEAGDVSRPIWVGRVVGDRRGADGRERRRPRSRRRRSCARDFGLIVVARRRQADDHALGRARAEPDDGQGRSRARSRSRAPSASCSRRRSSSTARAPRTRPSSATSCSPTSTSS